MAEKIKLPVVGTLGLKGLATPVLAIVMFILIGATARLSGLRPLWKVGIGIGSLIAGQRMSGFIRMLLRVAGIAFIVMGVIEVTGIIQPTGSLHVGFRGRRRATAKGAGF